MFKFVFAGAAIALALLIAGVAKSHGESAIPPPLPAEAISEPISGSTVAPAESHQPPAHEPFTPYSPGPSPTKETPRPYWTYNDLNADAKAAIDMSREATGNQEVHNAYAAAAAERAHRAAGDAAQHELGVDSLGTIGVIP